MIRQALLALLLLPGCEAVTSRLSDTPGPSPASAPFVPPETPEEVAAVVAAAGRSEAVPEGARTAEAFDTTTEAERAVAVQAAAEPPETPEEALGTTIATLGDPAEPGLWLATPLVSETRPGRLALADTGQSVLVELRPIEGPPTGGSRISLPAIRLLGVSLASLPKLEVFAR